MSPVAKALLSVFDEAHERKVVRTLIKAFEMQMADNVIELMNDLGAAIQHRDEARTERDFYKAQFEQVQVRLEALQGRV
ncbi:hypothetical protein [Mesorhizobium sp. M1252]|uniref:hypothetical protein n=1 Tax=Mesorhizobium sp. M1252 TaxID=2957073 RepID=UPI00333B8D83